MAPLARIQCSAALVSRPPEKAMPTFSPAGRCWRILAIVRIQPYIISDARFFSSQHRIGCSFGGSPHFPGQRFAGRLADDPPGQLTLREVVLAEGEASQSPTIRWEDYA